MEKKYDVFISYSRKDYLMDDEKTPDPGKIVSKILNVLDKHNISYWIDKEGMYSSVQFAAVIEEQISDARCFLFVSTQVSNASRYTLGEVFTAVEYGKPIIPFRADDSKFGKGIGFHLRPLDHIEYFKTGGEAFDKLVASIKHIKAEQLYDQLVAEYKSIASEYKAKLRAKSDEMKSLGITPPADGMADEEALQKIKFKYEQEMSRCQAEKANLMETVQNLQLQLESTKSDAQQILHQLKAKEEVLRDKIHEISFKLTESSKALTEKEHKLSSLEQSLSSTTNTLDNVQRELQKYKDAEAKQKAAEEARKKAEAEARRKAEEEKKRGIIKVGDVEFKMIHVEGGTFTMGATPEMEDPYNWEKPAHQVTLSSYSIGETPVTQALWQAVMGSKPSSFKGVNNPVESVSWNDCQEFIKILNQKTGKKFRLLTEAEWEFAARGGNKSNHTQYSGSDNLDDVAWFDSNSGSKTHPVKNKKPNELGIYDMSGNVWEWCQDWYGNYKNGSQTNPVGPTSGSDRVSRGGSWDDDARNCRLSYRSNRSPGNTYSNRGFRLALSE